MVTEIKMWEASDGARFKTRGDAEKYESALRFVKSTPTKHFGSKLTGETLHALLSDLLDQGWTFTPPGTADVAR